MNMQVFKLVGIIAVTIMLTSCSGAQESNYRLSMKVGDVTASPNDTLIAVPVYISHPQDTLAGIEVHFRIEKNQNVSFASDTKRPDSLPVAVDTTGSMIAGWEWLGVNSLDDDIYDIRVVALADWPNQMVMPPAKPSKKETLMTLYLRLDKTAPIAEKKTLNISVNTDKTSFADPKGNTIGLVTAVERVCSQYVGDSCVSWKHMKVGKLDTAIVNFTGGSITVPAGGK